MYLKRLRELREEKELYQKDIAKMIFTSKDNYYLYESGKRTIPLDSLIILAKFYDVTLDYLCELTDKRN